MSYQTNLDDCTTLLQEKLREENRVYQHSKKQVTLKKTDTDFNASPIVHSEQNVPVLSVREIRAKVEQIVSLKNIRDTDKNKVVQLKQIEKEHYKPFIQQLAYKMTQEELKDLVEVLADLGYLTTKLGELSGEVNYYTDAAVFYQYVITIVNEKLTSESKNTFIKQELTNPYQQLTHIQELIFSAIGGDREKMPVVKEEATSNKKILSKLRLRADLNMKMIEINYRRQVNGDKHEEKQKNQALYVKAARGLFEDTANVMQKFLAKLYSDSEKELNIPPPCKYAVIGLGSMALKQMTPYSDLEFAILIENEGQDESEGSKIKQYFKNLSYLVNFKMINLGETIIPTSKYKLDMSHLVHRGVNFDLGGKTPLGRIEGDKQCELIKTVEWMLYYVRNKGDKASKIDKNLPYILEKVCFVHGEEEFVMEYQGKVREFLHSKDDEQNRFNYETRARKLLTEETVEINYPKKTLSLDPKKGDLDKFEPDFSSYTEGRLFDVKQEIYRLPDRMVYNLGMLCGIEGDSAWDIIDKLEDQRVINSKAATNLKNAVTFATTLRLKTYLYYKAQTEDMSIFVRPADTESELNAQAKQIFRLPEEELGEQGGLFQYFYTALPLHKKLEEFCKQYQKLDLSKVTFFQDNKFYTDDNVIKGFIHYRLTQYKKAQSNLEEALGNSGNQDNIQLRLTLGHIYNNFGDGDKAIEQFQYCLEMTQEIYKNQSHPVVADCLINLGSVYDSRGQYDLAIEYYTKNMEMRKLIYKDQRHPSVAGSYNNLGLVYHHKADYNTAIKYYNKSLKIYKLIYKKEPHLDVASSINNRGIVFARKSQYNKAIEYYTQSLEMLKLIYKDEPHPSVAGCLNNLGEVHCQKRHHNEAIEYLTQSLEMNKLIYKDKSHPSVARSLYNLGEVHRQKRQYDKAIEYLTQSLEIKKLIYKDEPHPSVALCLNNLGGVYCQIEFYDKAMEYVTQSLDMRKLIYKDEPHPFVADSLHNLGKIYYKKGLYDKTMEYLTQSLEMGKLIYNDEPHHSVANSLYSLCAVYCRIGRDDKARECYDECLKMKNEINKDEHRSPWLNRMIII